MLPGLTTRAGACDTGDGPSRRCRGWGRRVRGTKDFHHPVLGDITTTYNRMDLAVESGLAITIYTAEPGSTSAEALSPPSEAGPPRRGSQSYRTPNLVPNRRPSRVWNTQNRSYGRQPAA